MTVEEENRFAEMCIRFGLDEAKTSEMRNFIESVGEAAHSRGETAGAIPFSGSWPTEE